MFWESWPGWLSAPEASQNIVFFVLCFCFFVFLMVFHGLAWTKLFSEGKPIFSGDLTRCLAGCVAGWLPAGWLPTCLAVQATCFDC